MSGACVEEETGDARWRQKEAEEEGGGWAGSGTEKSQRKESQGKWGETRRVTREESVSGKRGDKAALWENYVCFSPYSLLCDGELQNSNVISEKTSEWDGDD